MLVNAFILNLKSYTELIAGFISVAKFTRHNENKINVN
jgi:hypothetical protein